MQLYFVKGHASFSASGARAGGGGGRGCERYSPGQRRNLQAVPSGLGQAGGAKLGGALQQARGGARFCMGAGAAGVCVTKYACVFRNV